MQNTHAEQAGSSAATTATETRPTSSSGSLALQRSVAIYKCEEGGEGLRGDSLYYFKCWYCHNKYTVAEGTGAVSLNDLSKRGTLLTTGQPASDEAVAKLIMDGTPGMPAYRYSLSDADMAALLSYLRDDSCCFEDIRPPNPRYRY